VFYDPYAILDDCFHCTTPGCISSTRVARFNLVTMRARMSWCTEHMNKLDEGAKKRKESKAGGRGA
jgi:hypothetical protein